MVTHKFTVGQDLYFSSGFGDNNKRKGRYKVVRRLPEADSVLQYRIKSEMDGQERVVRENEIERRR